MAGQTCSAWTHASHEEVGHEVRLRARGVDAVGREVNDARRPQHVVVDEEEAAAEGRGEGEEGRWKRVAQGA